MPGGRSDVLPFLVAPLGASAVLVFCVPASPLAQPWAVIGGDLLSAAVGLIAGHLIGDPWAAGALERIGEGDDVVIVGTGLTMVDMVLWLQARGWRGRALRARW